MSTKRRSPRSRRDPIMVSPRRPPSKPLARAHHEMRQLRNKLHDQELLISALNEKLMRAEVAKSAAEHTMRMARPSKPQLEALRAVCLITALDAYRISPGLASSLSELSRWLIEIQSPPSPDTVMCQTAIPLPAGAMVVPLPPEARLRQRGR